MSVFDRALERATRFLDDVLLLPDAIRVELEDAEKELAAGKHLEAEKTFKLILGARPNLLRAQVGYARALAARGALREASEIVATAREAAPDDPALALLSARFALEAGDTGRAITLSREAARRVAETGGPLLAEACALRARAEMIRGRPDRAARELKKAVAAQPDDVQHKLALVEALAQLGDAGGATRVARAIPDAAASPDVSARLALALRAAGETRSVAELLERAAKAGHTGALVALASDALARGELDAAEGHARMAIARGGGGPALEMLSRVLGQRDKLVEAADALLAAADATTDAAERRALEVRAGELVPLDETSTLTRFADRLEGHPLGRVIRAHALISLGDVEGAAALLGPAVEGTPEPARATLARARIALERPGGERDALGSLDALLGQPLSASDTRSSSSLRRRALAALYHKAGELDLAAALDHVRALGETEGLVTLRDGAREIRDELDRPLLLAILGEFNAGKSTLVNAFVGAEVAPTGILPTTATLNVLRGGAERRVRVVRKDGTTREGSYDDVKRLLEDANAEGHAVDHVEIVLPSELLERVWILDTPGSNAPDPDHERLAREAMRRADAALWIFDAGQAGKATEGSVLAAVRKSRREVVAALNKTDRLKPGELPIVQRALREAMPELPFDAIPVSARQALKARLSGAPLGPGDAALEASGFVALIAALETEVFSRSRALKRRACGGRLLSLLEETLGGEASERERVLVRAKEAQAQTAALSRLEPLLSADVESAITELEASQTNAFHEAAREVLAFVRPRTNRFAAHGADPEDRAFLQETIQARLENASEAAASSLLDAVTARLRGGVSEARLGELTLRLRSAIAPPMAAFAGYQAGLLAGGGLRKFFDEVLPHAELLLPPLVEALSVARAHPRETLKPALEAALTALVRELREEAARAVVSARADEALLLARRYEPLRVLHAVLEDLVDAAVVRPGPDRPRKDP